MVWYSLVESYQRTQHRLYSDDTIMIVVDIVYHDLVLKSVFESFMLRVGQEAYMQTK